MGTEGEVAVEDEERWVKHYSSNHCILLVGEGDFSFSSSLALSFGSASNIVATSLDPYDIVVKKYTNAKSNLDNLLKLGASTLHGVDATKMKLHPDLKMQKFDRIVFNFPHAGFYGKEDNVHLIGKHKELVLGFFRNASVMLRAYGEIHVAHKTSPPFCHWNIEELAWRNSLALVECVDFKIEDYPGYNNKRGDGNRCDAPFPLGECGTFKFRFFPTIKKSKVNHLDFTHKNINLSQVNPIQTHSEPTSFYNRHQPSFFVNMNSFWGYRPSPLVLSSKSCDLFDRHYNHASRVYERATTSVGYFPVGAQTRDYERYMAEPARRSQQFQDTPINIQHEQAPVDPMNPQTSFNINMNELPGYKGAPLTISIRQQSVNAPHGYLNRFFEEILRPKELLYVQHSERTRMSDLERSVANAPGRAFRSEEDRDSIKEAWLRTLVMHYGQERPRQYGLR